MRPTLALAIFLYCATYFTAHAQQGKLAIDSLKAELAKPLPDSLKMQVLSRLSRSYCFVQPDSAIVFAKQLLAMANRAKNNDRIGDAYTNLGIANDIKGNYPEALKLFLQSLRIFERSNNQQSIGALYSNIANIYMRDKMFDQALDYYNKSLAIREKINDKRGEAVTLNNIAGLYSRQNQDSLSLAYNLRSLAIKTQLNDKRGIAYSTHSIGINYGKMNDFAKGEQYQRKAMKMFVELNDKNGEMYANDALGGLFVDKKDYKSAIPVITRAIELARQANAKPIIEGAAARLAKCYAALGNYQKAYELDTLSRRYRDSIFTEDALNQVRNLKFEYEIEKKELENQRLKKEQEAQSAKIALQQLAFDSQRKINIGISAALVALGALAYLFFRGRQQERLAKQQLAQLNKETTQQRDSLQLLNEELNQKNEEIATQRDDIEQKNYQLARQNDDITASISYAQRIQQAILPDMAELRQSLPELFVLFRPRDIVSGDFYWTAKVPTANGERLFLAAVDCTGHGVPGALMSMVGDSLLSQIVLDKNVLEPHLILAELHQSVVKALRQGTTDSRDGMEAALVAIDFNAQGHPLALSYAGAMNPLYYVQQGQFHEIKADKMPIGGMQTGKERAFHLHHIALDGPTHLYLCSDGFQDQFGGPQGRKFMVKRFKELLHAIHQLSAAEQAQALEQSLNEWQGHRYAQVDDILVIGVRVG